ncbi:MAG: PAS domain S-box protein [Acidobacteria bacterium]|nr:PAS domain S-box protein [Acidobacteriota bacterium]
MTNPSTWRVPGRTGPKPEELRRLRLAIEASGEIIFTTDEAGTFTYVNPQFERVYGYTAAEVVGQTTPRLLKSGTTSLEEYSAFWAQLKAGATVRRDFQNRTKSGELLFIEAVINPIVIDGGVVEGYVAVQRDVTAQRATQAALSESEQRYRTLADTARDGIFIVDHLGRVEYVNGVSAAQFGKASAADIIGRRLDEVFQADTAADMWRRLAPVFDTAQPCFVEDAFQTPRGQIFLETSLAPIMNGGLRPHAVMGVAREVTDRKTLERELLQAQKMEAVGRLAGGIAHDFNNLLTAILGYADFVREGLEAAAPALLADLQEVVKAGERATRLTRQLLAFSRRQPMSPQQVDLNALTGETHKMLARLLGEDLELVLVTEPALWPIVADAGQIEQVLVNLAVNARDAMAKGGRLTISTANATLDEGFARAHAGAVAGDYVCLTIHDTGCGMTPEVLAHAFEPFFTTKPQGKGTGLGLAIVYGIVKQNGGAITIDSRPGDGTRITIFWPRHAGAAARAGEASAGAQRLEGSETILLAEDETDVRSMIRKGLERYGYTVLEASDAPHAARLADAHDGPIDLLITDVIMPALSGPDVAQRVVIARPEARVLYVSGFPSTLLSDRCDSRRTWFLGKPFTPQELARKVRECLDAGRPGRAAPGPQATRAEAS